MQHRFLSSAALTLCAWAVLTLAAPSPVCAQILFDNTKAETAGNADWIIDTHQPVPSPTITNITSGTAESYWTGALSSWGVAVAKLRNSGQITLGGDGLETLPTTGRITYGDGSNAQDLSHYQVYVVCEPNILFTTTEKTAIVNFVKNGGGLFMVADHNGSDRNSDGTDSLAAWNDLMSNNTVQSNPFGFAFNVVDVSPSSPSADSSTSNPMTHGPAGTVTTLAYADGTTMTINNTTATHAAVWTSSSTTGVMALYGTYGAGRFCAIGDSSVVEDVTSSQGTTFAGWTTADNGTCALNGTIWLLGSGGTNIAPTITTGAASSITTTGATLNATVNPNGQSTTVQFQYGLTTTYTSTSSVVGTFTGTNTQATNLTVSGLTAGTLYHFRAVATNAAGLSTGSDATFTTATTPSVDLAVTSAHSGNFTQGDAADTYTITVTNIGSLASSGTVTVSNTLPTGLTATAISGTGWSTSLATLTATRSDSLTAGAAYPALTITVSVAANAPATVTNSVTVSGGGDTNLVNNTATDVTTINVSGGGGGTTYTGVLAAWDVSGQTAFGVSPLAPTTNAANLTIGGLTRALGVTTTGTASAKAWGGTAWKSASEAAAISANEFATVSVTAQTGYKTSISSISEFDYRRSSGGPPNGELQYQIGSGTFTDIIALSYPSTTGASLGPIDLTGVSALQNVAAGTTITFRIVNYGASSSGGTWYILYLTNTPPLAFTIQGTVTSLTPATTPDLVTAVTHTGSFTQGDTNDTCTLTVTNIGTGASTGSVSLTATLPAGLTATAISGTGWTTNLATLTCTRSDALAAGSSYPPITLTVKVSTNAAASVTNLLTVSGGGETNTINNTAFDIIAITQLTPIAAWRLQFFGSTNNTGNAADLHVSSADGMPNLLKYALGINPLTVSTNPVIGDIKTGHLRLTAPKNPNATDVTFTAEINADLFSPWTTNGTIVDQNTTTLWQAHATNNVSADTNRYIRLRVSGP